MAAIVRFLRGAGAGAEGIAAKGDSPGCCSTQARYHSINCFSSMGRVSASTSALSNTIVGAQSSSVALRKNSLLRATATSSASVMRLETSGSVIRRRRSSSSGSSCTLESENLGARMDVQRSMNILSPGIPFGMRGYAVLPVNAS